MHKRLIIVNLEWRTRDDCTNPGHHEHCGTSVRAPDVAPATRTNVAAAEWVLVGGGGLHHRNRLGRCGGQHQSDAELSPAETQWARLT